VSISVFVTPFHFLVSYMPATSVTSCYNRLCYTVLLFAQCVIYINFFLLLVVNTELILVTSVTVDLVDCAFSACCVVHMCVFWAVLSACCEAVRACASYS
jgi:hypothetical protein